MSADSAVTYTSIHSKARSWSIPSEDRYEEAVQQLFEQAPRSLEYVPEDHAPVYIPEPEHSEDLVQLEDEAPTPLLPPSFLALRIRPLSPRALETTIEDQTLDTERRIMTALELVNRRVSYQVDVCTRESSEFCTRHHDAQTDRAAVRAEIERQAADDLAVSVIMRTQPWRRSRAALHIGRTLLAILLGPTSNSRNSRLVGLHVDFICYLAIREAFCTKQIHGFSMIIYGMDYYEKQAGLGMATLAIGFRPRQPKILANALTLDSNMQPFGLQGHLRESSDSLGWFEKMEPYYWGKEGSSCLHARDNMKKMMTDQQLALIVKGIKIGRPAEVIEFTTELMEDKTHAYAERQAERKRKNDDFSRNNQNQQVKRQNTGQAYTAGNSGRKSYAGSQIDITPSTLDHYYDVELADGRIIGLNIILKGCTLNFLNHSFNINLMPVELGSFDAIIGMDWLAKYQAVIVCAEKIVRIPWGNETLIIHGDGSNQGNVTRLNIISCTKTQKYMQKGFPIFLAHVTAKEVEDKSEKKRLEDVPIVRDFLEIFPEDN
ncbi:putative reverse transcriptase domain-containing protein [Tanacetum coccineum]